jgi:hypothetical protein
MKQFTPAGLAALTLLCATRIGHFRQILAAIVNDVVLRRLKGVVRINVLVSRQTYTVGEEGEKEEHTGDMRKERGKRTASRMHAQIAFKGQWRARTG